MALELAQKFGRDDSEIMTQQGRPQGRRRGLYSKPDASREFERESNGDIESDGLNNSSSRMARRESTALRHDNPLMRQEKNQWVTEKNPYSDPYMLSKMDASLNRLNEIQRDIDRLRAGIGTELAELEKWQAAVDEMKGSITEQIDVSTKASSSKTEEMVRGLDASLGKLSTKKAHRRTNLMVGIGLFVTGANTFGIVVIIMILLGML